MNFELLKSCFPFLVTGITGVCYQGQLNFSWHWCFNLSPSITHVLSGAQWILLEIFSLSWRAPQELCVRCNPALPSSFPSLLNPSLSSFSLASPILLVLSSLHFMLWDTALCIPSRTQTQLSSPEWHWICDLPDPMSWALELQVYDTDIQEYVIYLFNHKSWK